ncbi:MAG: hypothetical protein QF442_01800 [Candidatus Peribacteraceae bacterium]|nr:hypothetical protein [Candidatus Peribacteraceae bacterium]
MATYNPMSLLTSLLSTLFVQTIHAQSLIKDIPGCNTKETLEDGTVDHSLLTDGVINAGMCIPAFIAHVIQFLFGFAGGICLLVIIWSGYEIVLGSLPGGSSEAGKSRLTWAIIGFIMASTSFFIMDFIISAIAGPGGP